MSPRSTPLTDLRAEFPAERLAQVLEVIAAGRLDASLGLASTPEGEALLHLPRGAAGFVLKVFARKRRIIQRFSRSSTPGGEKGSPPPTPGATFGDSVLYAV